uniref:Uncharacterized protein n=1 Tax=Penaeus semisulcatus majanivirus TaxID=2984274 RepID=A0A9C7C5T6_9VIRU|nr:MAG: hypothetical protein [Penaeus semisulcatus majanivirus]
MSQQAAETRVRREDDSVYERHIVEKCSTMKQLQHCSDYTLRRVDRDVIETSLPRIENSANPTVFGPELSDPIIFALSRVCDGNYYDLVFTHSCDSSLKPQLSLWYLRRSLPEVPYVHSGDVRDGPTLLQMMNIVCGHMDPNSDSIVGAVTAHAHDLRLFRDIAGCQPCICIPDHGRRIIHFMPCPLDFDAVGSGDVRHIVKYAIIPRERKIQWIFPIVTVYGCIRDTVGRFADRLFGESRAPYGKGPYGILFGLYGDGLYDHSYKAPIPYKIGIGLDKLEFFCRLPLHQQQSENERLRKITLQKQKQRQTVTCDNRRIAGKKRKQRLRGVPKRQRRTAKRLLDMPNNADLQSDEIVADAQMTIDDFMSRRCQKVGAITFEVNVYELKKVASVLSYSPIYRWWEMENIENNLTWKKRGSVDIEREGLLSIDKKQHNVWGKLPEKSIYDATTPLSFSTSRVEGGLRTDRRYLILPVADAVLEIMASERTMASYNWRAVERGGALDFVRTIVRGSIHDLTGTRRLDVGRPAVGYLALCVLASAMENVSEMYGEPPENPSPEYVQSKAVQVMRYLFGLCVSIMASGTNRALSDAYRIFTRLDSTSARVRLKPEDFHIIHSMVRAWPYLCFDTKKKEVVGRLVSVVERETERLVLGIIDTEMKRRSVDTVRKRDETLDHLRRKSEWSYKYVRPMCLVLLVHDYPFFRTWDDTVSVYRPSPPTHLLPPPAPGPLPASPPPESAIEARDFEKLKALYAQATEEYPQITQKSGFAKIVGKFLASQIKDVRVVRHAALNKYIKSSDVIYPEKKRLQIAIEQNDETALERATADVSTAIRRLESVYGNRSKIPGRDLQILDMVHRHGGTKCGLWGKNYWFLKRSIKQHRYFSILPSPRFIPYLSPEPALPAIHDGLGYYNALIDIVYKIKQSVSYVFLSSLFYDFHEHSITDYGTYTHCTDCMLYYNMGHRKDFSANIIRHYISKHYEANIDKYRARKEPCI